LIYLFSKNQKNDEYAITIREILFLFFIFTYILFLLFPKETLEQKVLKEEKSNDLVLVYIENMIKFDPGNYKLLLHFADISLKEDNFYAVKGVVEMLLRVPDKKAREEAIIIGEKLFKRQYFLLKEQKQKEELLKEYKDTLYEMAIISKDEKLKEDILSYIWAQKDKKEYFKFLKGLAKTNLKWKIKLADYYVAHSKHKTAFELYKEMFEKKGLSYAQKKIIFSKMIDVLIYGSLFEEGTEIVKKSEDLFLKDREISRKIIKFYLFADRAKDARAFVLKR